MMKNLNRLLFLYAFIGVLGFGYQSDMFGKSIPVVSKKQARLLDEEYKAIKSGDLLTAAAKASAAGTDHGLDENYCADDASFVMTPTFNEVELSGGYWKGAPDEPWVDPATGEFIPSNVPEASLGNFIPVTYIVDDAMGTPQEFRDYTKVQPLPTAYDLSGPNELCGGQSITLSLSSSQGSAMYYLMRDPDFDGPLVSSVYSSMPGTDGSLDFSVSAGGRYTIEAEQNYVDADCRNVMNNVLDVTEHILPNPTASNDSPVCEGEDVNLTGGPGSMVSYSWSGPDSYSSSEQSPLISDIALAGDGVYTLTVVDGNGCTNDITTTVTVNANPSITAGSNSPICEDSDINLTSTPSGGSGTYDTFAWTGPNSFSSGDQNPTIAAATTAAAGTYRVTVTDDLGCSTTAEATTDVVVNTRPTVSLSYNDKVCLNTNLILTATPSGGSGNFVNYVWTKDGVIVAGENGSTLTIASAALSDAVEYTVTVEDDNGCISDLATVDVIVYSLPSATASNDGPVCEGDDLNFTGGPGAMDNYSWSGPNSYSSNSQSPSITGITLAGDGVYTLTVTDGNGCTDSESTTVIVNENPTITAGSDSPICQGSDLHLTSTPAGGSGTYDTFLWSGPNSFSSGDEDPTILAATTAATGTYSVMVTDDLGCSAIAAATTDVTVNVRPTVSLSYNDKVCLNTSLVLTAAPAGGSGNYVNYVWRKGGTIIGNGISSTFTVTSSAALSDAGNYSVTVEDDSGCVSDEDFEVVTIYGLPTATASNNGPLCEGEDLSLTGGPAAMTTYSWSGPNSYSSSSQSPSIIGITLAGDGVYTLTVTDGNGCTDSESTAVVVNENPTITAGSDSPICQGSDLHLTSTPAGGSGTYDTFLWSGPNSFSSGDEDPTILAATTAATGTYSVMVTDDLGCSAIAAATTDVTVNVRPTVSLSYNDKVCLNTSLVLTAASAGGSGNYVNYVWRKGGVVIGSGSSNSYTVTSSAALSDAGNYSVTVEDDNGCISDEDFELVNVYNLPIVTASNNGPLCEGEDLILTGGPGAMDSYSWTGPDSFTSGSQSPTVSGVDINNAGTYTLTVIDANTCSASTTTDLTVNQIQSNISVSAPQPGATEACAGVDVTFNAAASLGSGNYSYDFHRIRGGVDQSVHTGSTTYTTPDLQDGDQVYVIATDNTTSCNDASNIITMSINANPVPALNITSAGGSVICLGSTVDFLALPGGFDRYVFYRNGSEVVQDGASNTYSNSTLVDGDQISVVAYDGDCFGASPAVTMTVHDLPTVSLSGDASIVCENQDVLFTATGAGTGSLTYQFLVDGNPETGIQAGNTFTWRSLNDFSVEVRIFDGNNCENISSAVDVTISKPIATLSADRTEICDGDEIVFTAGGGIGYEFFVNTVSTQGPGASDEFRSTTLANNDNVNVTITDTYGCTADHSGIAITVNPIPVPTLTSSDADNIICATDEVTFTAGGGDVFEFFVDGTSVQGPGNQDTYVTSSLNDGEKVSAEVSFSTSGCAATSAEITTTVNPLPTVGLSSDQVDDEFCLGTDVTFTATGATQYEFFVDGTSVQGPGVSDTYSDNSLLDGQVVSVIGTDGNSCENSASITVVVNEATATLTSDLGNSVCEGVEVTFTATGGVTYEFFVDGISVQAASATDTYVTNSLSDGETVSVTVTDVNGCIDNAEIVMTVIAAPLLSLSSSELDLEICQGDEVTFTASGATTYEFFLNGSSIQEPGPEAQYVTTTLNDGDIVYVVGNDGTCNGTSPDITMIVNPLPTATLSAVPGTSIIAGTNVAFTAGGGTEYVFAVNGSVVQPRDADNTYESNSLVDGDVVSVDVYDGNNCMSSESLTIRVFDSVILLDVLATYPDYCEGESGVGVYVGGTPQDGITYELFRSSDNSKVEPSIMYSSASPVDVRWNDIQGTDEYRVEAFYTDVPAERFEMNNRVTVTEYALPIIYNLTSVSSSPAVGCNGGSGHVISLDNSQTGVDYTLLLDDAPVETLSGTDGTQIDFNAQFGIGTYTIRAENMISGCMRYMSGTFVIQGDGSDVAFNVFVVDPARSGDITDGRYCQGEAGVEIRLDGSLDNTVSYKLFNDGIDTGVSVLGANGEISFGTISNEGTYTVRVESASGCQFPMTGSVDVSIIPTPSAFNLSAENDGHFCEGEAGVTFSIDDQEEDVEYSLYINGTTLLETVTGTDAAGSSLLFTGVYNTEGTYSVEAVVPEVGCTNAMNNTVEVVMDALPTVYDLTSDGDYCSGDVTFLHLPGSESNVEYRWHNDNFTPADFSDDSYGLWINGTGGVLDIEISNTGNYEITARRTDGVTSCESVMNGTFAITEKPLPEDRFISETYEGTGCGDGSIVTVIMSQAGVQYTLVKKVGTEYYDTGLPSITGDGNDIDFAPIVDKDNAEYTAMATLDGCSIYLSGSVFIDIAGVVTKQVVTGEGEICNGDPGVVFGLEDTEAGVTYELWLSHKYGVVGETAEETIVGDGNSMSFPLVNGEGEYLVVGVSATCELEMANRVELNVNPLPEAYKMIGSGEFCDPADGAEISLDNSEEGVSYMLQYFNGTILDDKLDVPAVGGVDTDTITFGKFTDIGTYTVIATTDKGCTSSMNGEVETHQSVTPVDQTVDYDSNVYCEGEGVEFKLTDHEAGVIYQVINDASVVIEEVEGTSSGELSLGIFTEGTYSFQATRGGDACVTAINGGIDITITSKAMPTEHEVIVDNEKICGSIGATITLDGFEVDRKYRIEASYGPILDTITGADRDPISWVVTEPVSGEETYEVWAMSMVDGECDSLMMGVVEVDFKEIPESFNVISEYEGIDDIVDYCEGADSISIRIENTQVDVAYMLVDTTDVNTALDVIIGNGSDQYYTKHFGEGGYTVKSILYTTGCEVLYNDTIEIKKNPTPTIEIFQIGDLDCSSEVCYGLVDSDELILDNSAPEEDLTVYSLLLNGAAIDPSVDSLSTGAPINFGSRSEDGIYTVQAISNMGCPAIMDGIIRLEQYPLNAEDDYLNLAKGENTGSVIVPGSDELTNDTWNPAIDYLYDPEVEGEGNLRFWFSPNSAVVAKDIESGSVIIDEKTGVLVYTKLPGFYGRDSVTYYFKNIDYPDTRPRIDSAKVYIFVGNKGIEDGKTFLIPNAFSPNGDDINDYFKISGIEEDGRYSAEKSKLEVFNRWGSLVYRSKGNTYGEDGEWWDGTSTTANMVSIGSDLPNGTYFYVYSVEVNVTGEDKTSVKEYSGYIELRR